MNYSPFREKDSTRLRPWQRKLNEVIFGADTFAGKTFDIVLIGVILASVIAVATESVESIRNVWGDELYWLEWGFTIVFTVEYLLRIASVKNPSRYMLSFYGIVDLLSILPTYLSLFVTGSSALLIIRILRVLRVFRILKLVEYMGEANLLVVAMQQSYRKILIFLYAVLTMTVIFGTIMYLVEGDEYGFTSIPRSVYWAIVTLTTVGYGDITPHTPLGQMISALVMISGYAIIAVPTGIYAAEIGEMLRVEKESVACVDCGKSGHEQDAIFCRKCGEKLRRE